MSRWLAVLALSGACGRTELVSLAVVDAGGLLDAGLADAGRIQDAGSTDAGTSPDAGPPTSCLNLPGPDGGTRCFARVRLASLVPSSPTCFVDVRVMVEETGVLEWECASSIGAAVVTFGAARFTGQVRGDLVDTCFGSEFDYSDGCRWTSAQAIRGARASGRLTLTYGEAPLPGQQGCLSACSATGTVELVP